MERREKIGLAFFAAVTPLDNFAVVDGILRFDNLAANRGFAEPAPVTAEWFAYEPGGCLGSRLEANGLRLPGAFLVARPGSVAVARLRLEGRPASQRVDVYVRKRLESEWDVAGVSRTW